MKIKDGDVVIIDNPICGVEKDYEDEIINKMFVAEKGTCHDYCNSKQKSERCKGKHKIYRIEEAVVCSCEVRKATDREKFLYYTYGSDVLRPNDD